MSKIVFSCLEIEQKVTQPKVLTVVYIKNSLSLTQMSTMNRIRECTNDENKTSSTQPPFTSSLLYNAILKKKKIGTQFDLL